MWQGHERRNSTIASTIDELPPKFRTVASARIDLHSDDRPYLFVNIFANKYKGLLDSGAQTTIINEKLLTKLTHHNLKLKPCNVVITTADGSKHRALGYVEIPFVVKGIQRIIATLAVKQASIELILGIDFWNAFQIKPCFTTSNFGIEVCQGQSNENDPNENKEIENFAADLTPPKCINVEEKHELTAEQMAQLDQVKALFPFCNPAGELNATHLREAKIETGDAFPVRCKLRVDPPWKLKKIIAEIDRLQSRGIIQKVEFSEWLLPIIAVPKPNVKTRICLDARKLNDLTKKNAYPQQNANRILCLIGKANYITTIDMTDAFFQIPLHAGSRAKTAFAVPTRGTYVYKRMPMGLTNSGAELCALIDSLFGSEFEPYAFPYLDDVVIVTETFEKHIEILTRLANKFKFANLSISPEKSKFCFKRLKYLGHIIGERGVAMDKTRIEAVRNFPTPKNIKDVQR